MTHVNPSFPSAGDRLQRLDPALDALAGTLQPVAGLEEVPTREAHGRIAGAGARAVLPVPGFDNAAVDGYAIRFDDLATEGETRLPVIARIPAGARDVAPLAKSSAARIFTGAPMPQGADTVFMQEDVRRDGEDVILPPGLRVGANCRVAGEDFAVGAPVVRAGERLGAHHIAALVATGIHRVTVRRPLRVAVFSTGDELVDAAETLPAGVRFDSNRPMLLALLARRGIEAVDLGILPDRREAISAALREAARTSDAILTSGGVSTGEEDHVKAAVEAEGTLDFWRLAIKPGKPVAMGHVGGKTFFGLPGNPGAVFITFARFVGPVLDLLAGGFPNRPPGMPVHAGFAYRRKPGRLEYARVVLQVENGRMIARRLEKDGAAMLSSLVVAEGLVEIEEDRAAIEEGEVVRFLSFAELMI